MHTTLTSKVGPQGSPGGGSNRKINGPRRAYIHRSKHTYRAYMRGRTYRHTGRKNILTGRLSVKHTYHTGIHAYNIYISANIHTDIHTARHPYMRTDNHTKIRQTDGRAHR